jgi:AbrB family looped-hinge helix DNA binding protein
VLRLGDARSVWDKERATRTEATRARRGQVTIPKAIRDCLGVRPGDRITFTPVPDRTVPMRIRGKVAENRLEIASRAGSAYFKNRRLIAIREPLRTWTVAQA